MKEKKKKGITVNYQSSRSSGHWACERGMNGQRERPDSRSWYDGAWDVQLLGDTRIPQRFLRQN